MQSLSAKDFDAASEFIINLQTISRKQLNAQRAMEYDLIQQLLDDELLFIKQVPYVLY